MRFSLGIYNLKLFIMIVFLMKLFLSNFVQAIFKPVSRILMCNATAASSGIEVSDLFVVDTVPLIWTAVLL